MKIILYILIIMLLSSCSTAVNEVNNYNVVLNLLETESPHMLNYFPYVKNDSLFLCDYNDYIDSIYGEADGNVIAADITSDVPKEKKLNIIAEAVYCYNDEIYYCQGIRTSKYNMQTGESTFVYDRGGQNHFFVSDDVEIWNDHMVWWESEEDLKTIKYYSYNLSDDKTTLLAETNHFFSIHVRLKIRNGYIAYSEKTPEGYNIYSVNVSTGKKKLLVENTIYVPIRMVYNGKTLVWSSKGKTHVLDGKNEVTIPIGGDDVDVYDNNVIYCDEGIIYVYNLNSNATVFTSDKDYGDYDFSEWFSLDEESGIAAFRATNWELSKKKYPNWEYDIDPDYIFWLKFEKQEKTS